jgi:alanine racemase
VSGLIRALIDTRALGHNLEVIRSRAGAARVMAVVKANAYGHGLTATAQALADADAFAVARLEEGIALRSAGMSQPVVLLEGVFTAEQLHAAADHRLDLVVHDPLQLELLEEANNASRFVIWVKIDTGMNRLGFAPGQFPPALARLRALTPPPQHIRLMTHLACANERDEGMTRAQLERFRKAIHGLSFHTSIANSAGIFGPMPIGGDWVRPGIALYGVSPFSDCLGTDLGLAPVMTLTTSVIALRRIARGETVGYGGTWVAPRDAAIAIVAGGYGDGVPRNLAPGTAILVDGRPAPLAGRVSMDMLAVDVSGLEGVRVGTPVVLWGAGLPVEEQARRAGTIAYELLCSVSQRVPLEPR